MNAELDRQSLITMDMTRGTCKGNLNVSPLLVRERYAPNWMPSLKILTQWNLISQTEVLVKLTM